MPDSEQESGDAPGYSTPGVFRFRANPQIGGEPSRRYYRAMYSHETGWSVFNISIDLGRNVCTFHRSPGTDYRILLRDLSMALTGNPAPGATIGPPCDLLAFDFELIGMKMSRAATSTGARGPRGSSGFRADPPGDWLVMQLFVHGSADSFLLCLNDRIAAGEIVLTSPSTGAAVLRVFEPLFV